MSRLMQCDGCGNISSEKTGEIEKEEVWLELKEIYGSSGGSASLFPAIHLSGMDEEEEVEQYPDLRPDLHFCELECLSTWARMKLMEEFGK